MNALSLIPEWMVSQIVAFDQRMKLTLNLDCISLTLENHAISVSIVRENKQHLKMGLYYL